MGDTVGEFLQQAHGQAFCDGCLAVELRLERSDVGAVLQDDTTPIDRGHGRCSVCGQTLTVTRALRP